MPAQIRQVCFLLPCSLVLTQQQRVASLLSCAHTQQEPARWDSSLAPEVEMEWDRLEARYGYDDQTQVKRSIFFFSSGLFRCWLFPL